MRETKLWLNNFKIFARYKMAPSRMHPESGRVGLSLANCWLKVLSFDAAREIAGRSIRGLGRRSLLPALGGVVEAEALRVERR